MWDGVRFPTLAFSGLLNCALVNWVNSAGLPRRGTSHAFPSAAAGKRISSLCQLVVVGEGRGHLSFTPNTTMQMREASSGMPPSHTQGWLTCIVVYRVNPILLAR